MPDVSRIEGVAAPLPIANLDTDQIMPKQFLLGIDKSGLARGLLYNLRFDAHGEADPEFILNRPEYAHARVLVGGPNFGCGSSREHAVWGLQQGGFAAVLAPSYGEIFYYNALNNRFLPIVLPAAAIDEILAEVADPSSNRVEIDVVESRVRTASGRVFGFDMPARHRQMYLDGLDVLGATLQWLPRIEDFERSHWAERTWARVLPSTSLQGKS
jgi:3-isopropylmalate/(R)-2-methylmalate dehydratase small subunit